MRSKVEHPFQVIKQRFGWVKTRYRGVKKNLHKARVMACLSNLAMLASAGRSLDPPPQRPALGEYALNRLKPQVGGYMGDGNHD